MDIVKGGISLIGTAVIAGWVAYSVSAPRNVENAMNEPMAQLGGRSINEEMARSKAEAYAAQCAQVTAMADEAWDRAVERGTTERDQSTFDEYDRQKAKYCNP